MRYHKAPNRGYSLLQLMIVILIICVLLALLLPAIQASREAARRTQCNNNLKNISLGLQNYHDTYKMFPMGAMHAGDYLHRDPPNDSRLGPSWWYGIYPFMESSNYYDRISATQRVGGPARNEFCANDMIAARVTLTVGLAPDFMRCPSSPLPVFQTKSGPICLPTYVGITGGCDIDPASPDYANTAPVAAPEWPHVYCNPAKGTGAAAGGIVTSSGMLPPCEQLPMSECTDGTSNTMIVGEQSDWLRDRTAGSRTGYHGDSGWTVGGTGPGGGWLSGTRRCDPVPKIDIRDGLPAAWGADCWNLTTVHYPPGYKHVLGTSPLPGCSENHGINNPLQSPHPGGTLVAFVDGAVPFIASSSELHVLLRQAIRNDGNGRMFAK